MSSSTSTTSKTISHNDLHKPSIDLTQLNIAPGVELNDLQKRHAAVVLDVFQAKLTRGKLMDNFMEDVVYEDAFAKCKDREELAGQLLNIPTITSSATIESYQITSNHPSTAESGSRKDIPCNEITIHSKHTFVFPIPLVPEGMKSITDETDLLVYSTPEGIVRLQDRPMERIPDNSFINIFRRFNAIAVPKVIPMPENDKEDAEKSLRQGI